MYYGQDCVIDMDYKCSENSMNGQHVWKVRKVVENSEKYDEKCMNCGEERTVEWNNRAYWGKQRNVGGVSMW